jgi:Uma2 family endonuclease
MTAARKWNLVSVEDYLAAELDSPVKREYVAGIVYALAGARNAHNIIGVNILGELRTRLRGGPCRAFNSDTKMRVRQPGQVRFYYPDTSVICKQNPPSDVYQDEPVVIFEVLSRKTRRIDLGEKKDAYPAIPSLCVYVVVEQDAPIVVVFRRTQAGFVREVFAGLDAILPLPEIGTELLLAEIYDGIEFTSEADEADDA